MNSIQAATSGQIRRNRKLLADAKYLGERITSKVLPLQIDVAYTTHLSQDQIHGLEALQIEAARTAIGAADKAAALPMKPRRDRAKGI